MRRELLLVGVLFIVGGRDAAAQALAQTEQGAREQAALTWQVPDAAAGFSALDVNALLALQVSAQQRSWGRRGAVIGALAGALTTYLVSHQGGSTALCDRDANQDAMGERECVALTVAGGFAGAGLGAWIGSRFRRD